MKRLFLSLAICLLVHTSFAAMTGPRTIKNIPDAAEGLRRMVSPKFYDSLLISPVAGWVTVRGTLLGTHLSNPTIISSDADEEFNTLALELANNLEIQGFRPTRTNIYAVPVLLHVAVYNIADGRLAVSFATLDFPGGDQFRYYGSAWMGVLKRNHLWEVIEPHWKNPYEHRGPRSYMLTLIEPGFLKNTTPRATGIPMGAAR
jgi:hypothetical protein